MTIVAANPNDPARPDLPDGTGFSVLAVLPDGTFDLMIDEPTAEERLASLVAALADAQSLEEIRTAAAGIV
jgi:hypothetical protein